MAERLGLEYTHDVRAERAVISTVVLDPPRIAEVQPLLPNPLAFFVPQNQAIYQAALELDADGRPIDAVTIAKRLQEVNKWGHVGSPYLADILDATPAVIHVEAHARIVRDKWRLRMAMAHAQTAIAKIRSGAAQSDADIQSLLEGTELAFSELAHLSHETGLRGVRDVLHEACTDLSSARTRGEMTGTDTGFERLNKKLAGLHDGDLLIVAGRPGSGKTGFAMNLAVNVASKGAAVAIFSLEMTDVALAYRMMGAEARVNTSLFRRPQALQPLDWNKIMDAVSRLSKTPVWIDDTPGITVADIRSRVRKLKQEVARDPQRCPLGLRVVVVDYMQLCTVRHTEGMRVNRQEIVAEISRGLKLLAKQENLCVVALSQLNRLIEQRGDKKRPQLSDLRESGAIEQDADTVLFVYRPDMYGDEADPELRGLAEIIVGKQRNGAVGTVKLRFTADYVRFDTLAETEFGMYDSAEDDDSWFDDA